MFGTSPLKPLILMTFAASFLFLSTSTWGQTKVLTKVPKKVDKPMSILRNNTSTKGKNYFQSGPGYYYVQKGDTLWDISRRFLGSSWYWPKLWSTNPHIQNPHWIFPGNRLDFFKGGEFRIFKKKKEWADLSQSRIGHRVSSDDISFAKGAFTFKKDDFSKYKKIYRRLSFLRTKKVKRRGFIDNGPVIRTLYGNYDLVFLKLGNLKNVIVGDEYTVYRIARDKNLQPSKPLTDPASGESLGLRILLCGNVKVIRIEKNRALARVTRAYRAIHKNDFLGDYLSPNVKVAKRRSESLVKGHVVRSLRDNLLYGKDFKIFINRGRRHGLYPGNIVDIYKYGGMMRNPNSLKSRKKQHLKFKIGEAILIDVRLKSSLAYVTKSSEEVVRGDSIATSLAN